MLARDGKCDAGNAVTDIIVHFSEAAKPHREPARPEGGIGLSHIIVLSIGYITSWGFRG